MSTEAIGLPALDCPPVGDRVRDTVQIVLRDLSRRPLEGWEGAQPRVVSRLSHFRSASALIRVAHGRRHLDMFLKCVPGMSAVREYDTLVEAYRLFEHQTRLAVPRPYRIYADAGALLMEACPGHSMTRFLSRRAPFGRIDFVRRPCVDLAVQCAQWLKIFHRASERMADRGVLIDDEMTSTAGKLRTLAVAGAAYGGAALADALRQQWVRPDAIDWHRLETGVVHGDFGPHNIVVRPAGLTVLDLGDCRPGFLLEDVSRMALELRLRGAVSRMAATSRSYRELSDVFVATYGLDEADQRARQFFTAKAAVMLLLTIATFHESGRFRARWHGRAVAWLLTQLSSR